PAEVVITAADDLSEPDFVAMLPPVPEAAPVVIDIAAEPSQGGKMIDQNKIEHCVLTKPVPTFVRNALGVHLGDKPQEAVAEPVVVTAAITSVPARVEEAPALGEVPALDMALVLPDLPDPAPVVLDDLFQTRPASAPALAERQPEAGEAADFAPLIAQALPSALRLSWLPERDAREIVAVYAARGHQPFWFEGGGLSTAGQNLGAQLARAGEEGLRAADYALPRLILPRVSDLALADIRLTALAVRYARDARGARVDLRRISALITPQLAVPGAAEVLGRLGADGADAGQILASYLPQHEGYQALRRKLSELRSQRKAVDPTSVPQVRIPQGPAIRMGMRDDRIVLIRAHFGFAPDETRIHDRSLATVVAGFQRDNRLPANGVLNRATVDAMNGRASSRANGDTNGRAAWDLEADLIANMERWRWLPTDLGTEHLIVNVPEYVVRKVEDGRVVHNARVVVGKTERPTPIFSDMMDHLVINPSWTIPPTIMKEDILPKLASDPGYAERRGFQVIRRGNQISVRQPPGPTNALGNVKFMFPNDHAVYLHDTPSRGLFASSRRAFSSGCVRVEQPLKLAELVLGGRENGWSERRLQGMIGSGERTIRLTRKLPIHIVYMTHVVDDAGAVRSHEDIYGFHRRTRDALGL
ncbi:MAG: L,D-transpeptidase family protein, partial [Bosea sp. (in: a-proteobacteria)]